MDVAEAVEGAEVEEEKVLESDVTIAVIVGVCVVAEVDMVMRVHLESRPQNSLVWQYSKPFPQACNEKGKETSSNLQSSNFLSFPTS